MTPFILGPGVQVRVTELADAYALLERMVAQEARQQRVERFPYWAEVWPAALALARWLHERRPDPPHQALELGCGVGLVGVAAALLGWPVQATDFVEDALLFAAHNARQNGVGARHRVAYLDWRNPAGAPCDCLLASDVAYEQKNHPYLLRVLQDLLLPGGRLFLSDPGRPSTGRFVGLLTARGYAHSCEQVRQAWHTGDVGVDLHAFVKPAAA